MAESYGVVAVLSVDGKNFQVGIKQAQKSLNDFSGNFSKGFSKIPKVMAAVGTAVTGAFAGAVKIGSDFEAQMSRVQAISGATGEEFEKLRQQAIDLGADTAFSASEAAQGMENLAAAGFTTQEIMNAMPGLLNLAAASGEDLATSSDIAASALRGFGLNASEAGHVADVLAENANRTNSSVRETGEALKYIAPMARASGISLEETAAAIGIMANAGIQGSQAGTTLRGALARLSKPTDVMATAMEQLGVSFYDSNGKMKSLADQVDMLKGAMNGMTDEQKNYYLATLYGQEALSGMMVLINEGGDSLRGLATDYENCAGSAENAAKIMQDNFQGAVEQLKGSLESFGIQIFSKVSAPLSDMANVATEAVNNMTSAFESGGVVGAVNSLMTSIVTGITTFVPQILQKGYELVSQFAQGFAQGFPDALSKFLDFVQGIGDKIAEYAPVFIQKGFEILSNLATGIANAIPTIIEKVPTIITTFANVINDNFPIILLKGAQIIGQLALGIVKAIPALLANIPQIIEAIISLFTAFNWMSFGKSIFDLLGNGIKSAGSFVKSQAKNIQKGIIDAINNLPSVLGNLGKSAISKLGGSIRSGISTIVGFAKNIVTGIISAITSLPGKLASIGSNAISRLGSAIRSGVSSIPAHARNIVSGIKRAFTGINWGSIGSNIIKGIANGIAGAAGNVARAAVNAAKSAFNSAKKFLGIHSPSRLFRDKIGKYMALGLGVGFEKYAPIKEIKGSISDIMSDINDFANFNPISFADDLDRLSFAGMDYTLSAEYDYESNETYVIEVPVNLDGKEVSRVTAPFMRKDLDKIDSRNNRKHGIR